MRGEFAEIEAPFKGAVRLCEMLFQRILDLDELHRHRGHQSDLTPELGGENLVGGHEMRARSELRVGRHTPENATRSFERKGGFQVGTGSVTSDPLRDIARPPDMDADTVFENA